ncbi:MAG: insulinase family protein, partial [Steroidobacteraceae bacterium]
MVAYDRPRASRLSRRILTLPLLLTLSLLAGAASVPRVEFEKLTLANGLQVILHVDRKLPVVHVNQWFHVGSKNERAGRTGFAHLFEHMMFQGSKNASEDYFTYVGKAGANLFAGGVNGTTELDRTNYFATVPSGSLEYLLWLESDRLATLADALTQEKLDNQRNVVKNERRQSFENQPYGRAFKLVLENLYPQGHPYSWHVIGSHEDLTAASLDDVREFFRTYYTPNNLSLVIAGDFDIAQAKQLVEKYFGSIPPGPALDRIERWIPELPGEKVVEATDRVAQERVYIAWPAPAYFEAADAELQLASGILTDGLASRLKKALVYDRQLASEVSSVAQPGEISGLFAVVASARPGTSLSQIEQVVTQEIARLATAGPTADELQRVKAKIEYGFVSGLEDIGGFAGKAERLNMYNTYLGDPGRFDADLLRYRTASVASVRDAVDRWLNTRKRVVVRFHPEISGRVSQVTLDRSQAPPLGADKPFAAPAVKSSKLPNGLEVFVVERTELPKVVVTLATRAGATADPDGRAGLADMTASTLELGTKTRQALQIE